MILHIKSTKYWLLVKYLSRFIVWGNETSSHLRNAIFIFITRFCQIIWKDRNWIKVVEPGEKRNRANAHKAYATYVSRYLVHVEIAYVGCEHISRLLYDIMCKREILMWEIFLVIFISFATHPFLAVLKF